MSILVDALALLLRWLSTKVLIVPKDVIHAPIISQAYLIRIRSGVLTHYIEVSALAVLRLSFIIRATFGHALSSNESLAKLVSK